MSRSREGSDVARYRLGYHPVCLLPFRRDSETLWVDEMGARIFLTGHCLYIRGSSGDRKMEVQVSED